MENRLPGGDVNPYLALAAMLAGGLHGIEQELELEPASAATPTSPTSRRCRARCGRRATRSPPPPVAREVLGDEVVDHYTNKADVELAAFDAAVTDWELRRGFERM